MHFGLYLPVVRHLDLNIQPVPEYPGKESGAVLGDQHLHVHLGDHLKDHNSQADILDVDCLPCLGFRFVYCTEQWTCHNIFAVIM